MSTELMRFVVEATLVWGVLLAFYLIAFRKNSNWRAQRIFLVVSWSLGLVFAFLPPLFTIDPVLAEQLPSRIVDYVIPTIPSDKPLPTATELSIPWFHYLLRTWQYGALLALSISALGLWMHLRPRPRLPQRFEGFRVVKHESVSSPYAAFGTIYLPNNLSQNLEQTALIHEAVHLRRGHHYEQLWLTLGRCIFWFHPLAWAYTHLLGNIHEFEADEITSRTVAPRLYCQQLLRATLSFRLVPGLFSSPLKRRIMLLTTPQLNKRIGAARWAMFTLLLVGLFFACNKEEPEFNEEAWVAAIDAKNTDYPPRLAPGYSIGSMWHTLLDTIYHEVTYPREASVAGLQGTVLLRMDIDKNGKASYGPIPSSSRPSGTVGNDLPVQIITYTDATARKEIPRKSAESPFVDEVRRMAEYLSEIKWQPASKNGIPEDGSIYLTFNFKLEQ